MKYEHDLADMALDEPALVLVQWPILDHPLRAEPPKIQFVVEAEHELAEISADSGGLLKAVTRKAGGQVETRYVGPFTEDRVPVESVDRVQTRP